MKTTKINRLRLRRELGPSAQLTRHALTAGFGTGLLLIGFGISFKSLLNPALSSVEQLWNGMLRQIVPDDSLESTTHILGGILLVAGIWIFIRGLRALMHQLVSSPAQSGKEGSLVGAYVKRHQLDRGPKVVAIGGGTGLSTLLRGIKQHTHRISAIVTVTDDGGSSGKLIKEIGMIPPGDIRNCLAALADAEKLTTDLFQHRFESESGVFSGHSLGNLLIAGFLDQAGGDLDIALAHASEVLAIRGRVIPATTSIVGLMGVMDDGSEIFGETSIVESDKRIKRIHLTRGDVLPHPQALEAIRDADLICIGPGSVYTSIVPNLLVPGVADEIRKSSALKAFICNVMTQGGESDGFSASQHLKAIREHIDKPISDVMLVNTSIPSQEAVNKYSRYGQILVQPDTEIIRTMGVKPILGDFISDSNTVRHDPAKIASKLMDILYR
jgi:uncharacterized cofD-like protein